MQVEVHVWGIKASKGNFEGRDFDSTVFHIEADLKDNSAGPGVGRTISTMKFGTSEEFHKWKHLEKSMPIKCMAEYAIESDGKGNTTLALKALRPLERTKSA